jgi:hypothetical protein
MVDFKSNKEKQTDLFGVIPDLEKAQINTTVFKPGDSKFESPRLIGEKKVKCPECGAWFVPKKYDMKTGHKAFANEVANGEDA